MEAQISRPIEGGGEHGGRHLRTAVDLRSGVSIVIVTFELDRDIDIAAQDVRDRVANVIRRLPREAQPPAVSKFDNDQAPVLTLSLSGPRPLREFGRSSRTRS